jgi:hypothetical protein
MRIFKASPKKSNIIGLNFLCACVFTIYLKTIDGAIIMKLKENHVKTQLL